MFMRSLCSTFYNCMRTYNYYKIKSFAFRCLKFGFSLVWLLWKNWNLISCIMWKGIWYHSSLRTMFEQSSSSWLWNTNPVVDHFHAYWALCSFLSVSLFTPLPVPHWPHHCSFVISINISIVNVLAPSCLVICLQSFLAF